MNCIDGTFVLGSSLIHVRVKSSEPKGEVLLNFHTFQRLSIKGYLSLEEDTDFLIRALENHLFVKEIHLENLLGFRQKSRGIEDTLARYT